MENIEFGTKEGNLMLVEDSRVEIFLISYIDCFYDQLVILTVFSCEYNSTMYVLDVYTVYSNQL